MNALPVAIVARQRVQFWTAEAVEERLRDALKTLKRLPLTERDVPAQQRSHWPQVVQRLQDWLPEYGSLAFDVDLKHLNERIAEENHRERGCPSADAITRMEETLSWQHFVTPRRYWQAAAAVSLGASLRRVARDLGTSHETVRTWAGRAVSQIVVELNKGGCQT